MVLFNTSSRLSFSGKDTSDNDCRKKRSKRRRRRTIHTDTVQKHGFSVNIGEEQPLYMSIDNACKYTFLSDTESSVCVKVSYDNGTEDEVIVIKWSTVQRDVNTREHIALKLVNLDIIETPVYRYKGLIKHYNKFVSVGIRSYIKGVTLASVMKELSAEALDAIKLFVESISWKLAEIQSEFFGHIQYGQLKTTTPCGYVRTRTLLAKLEGKINTDKWTGKDPDNYQCKAVFCHGNLTPEHIILNGIDVVGIVGWSSADFMPEICDRLQYYFRSVPSDPLCWYRYMAETHACADAEGPSIDFVVNAATYEFYIARRNASKERKAELASLWKTITMNHTVVSCIATAKETKSDTMSQSSLTSWWNQSQHILSEDN